MWSDMVSRWAGNHIQEVHLRCMTLQSSKLTSKYTAPKKTYTTTQAHAHFEWPSKAEIVKSQNRHKTSRPLLSITDGNDIEAERPLLSRKEIYLPGPPESAGDTYLLVLKDEATHFCELTPRSTPTSTVAVEAILAWHSRYGRRQTSLQITEEIREHVSAQGQILAVEGLLDYRCNAQKKDYDILVSWKGLKPIEDSWKSAKSLTQDISTLLKQFAVTGDYSRFERHVGVLTQR
ncbi:LOW QUALITY PROTEIN: Hypothetical protein PHPALM_20508 [Phytophthora palmivora]|uniref:Chromo domain-containing protein n=1 Tax=Phytophthora palmivora TaxID=4796 RepID=A0A2P4XEQ6_9STRA|nr:LOW QUALITY PROTEIN: Hypothetical protein PHPALM_20508 [Phytophthora palmivora]